MLLLLFTRPGSGDILLPFPLSPPPLWEPTNRTEECISVPPWPPPIRSLPNRSSPEPWLKGAFNSWVSESQGAADMAVSLFYCLRGRCEAIQY